MVDSAQGATGKKAGGLGVDAVEHRISKNVLGEDSLEEYTVMDSMVRDSFGNLDPDYT